MSILHATKKRITAYSVCARLILFFFSSRRRHTRLVSDWSSDVCSSDLMISGVPRRQDAGDHGWDGGRPSRPEGDGRRARGKGASGGRRRRFETYVAEEIGRASCRERV